MAFPLPPDFTRAERGAAWWRLRLPAAGAPSRFARCATDGYTFVRGLQQVLQTSLGSGAAWDGATIAGSSVARDGKWGPATSRALWAALHAQGAPQAILDVVENEAKAQRLSWGSVKAALWYLYRATQTPYGQPAVEDIDVPTTTVPPRWKVDAPIPPGGGADVACVATDAAGNALPAAPPASSPPAQVPVINEDVPPPAAPTSPTDPYLAPAPPLLPPSGAMAAAGIAAGALVLVGVAYWYMRRAPAGRSTNGRR